MFGTSSAEPSQTRRKSSTASNKLNPHVPVNPSQLRESHVPSSEASLSPEESMSQRFAIDYTEASGSSQQLTRKPEFQSDGIHPTSDQASVHSSDGNTPIYPSGFAVDQESNLRTRLLSHKNWDQASGCGSENCNHGTLSPRPGTHGSYGSISSDMSRDGFGERFPGGFGNGPGKSVDNGHGILGDTITDGILGGNSGSKMSITQALANWHGIRHRGLMYLAYYIPVFNWAPQYTWSYLRGDLVAALTMASFYLPMSLSLASNLSHVPAINGLYSFVFNPLIYAILGTCPQMVVGPEAAGSLLTGEVVRENIRKGTTEDNDGTRNAEIAGIITCMAGGMILGAGLFRFGFLDSILSRPFLRGFISAIGVVIFMDQLIPEMGLSKLSSEVGGVAHGSTLDKVIFLCTNIRHAHMLTCAVSFGSFAIILFFRNLKKRLQPRYPSVAYVPDRFLVVVLSAVLAWQFRWDQQGLSVLGEVKASGKLFAIHWPFETSHLKYASDAFNTALIIALLGFFESSVAAKSLGSGEGDKNGTRSVPLSANRELIALGTANVVGGFFMALPAFGGYGRSKVNASTGGTTPMSSVFLSIITLICIFFLLPYFYYLPKGVLCAMISVVAYSLVEEAPSDIRFFWRIRSWSELVLMFLIFVTTVFWDIKKGIAVGIALSVLRLIRHSTKSRIQILGRVPGTTDSFANAEQDPRKLEFIEGCLIVKIPEPLTFANTGDLKNRLRRLEDHGTSTAHPALPRVRKEEHNKNIIFDVHGVTALDGAGVQVLSEIVQSYRTKGVRIFFSRVPNESSPVRRLFEASGIMEMCGGPRHFLNSVEEALRMTEMEDLEELGEYRDDPT